MAKEIELTSQKSPHLSDFHCGLGEVLRRVDNIDPRLYDKTRNYLDGAVTWLSPFLAHGVINTQVIAERVLEATNYCLSLPGESIFIEFGRHRANAFSVI